MSTPTPFTVLVNSSDGFDDCWQPFFTLFKKYWPSCRAPIYLNTETKSYRHEGLEVVCTRVQRDGGDRLPWSQCLLAALEQVDTPLVLYFHEDYFIQRPVLAHTVQQAAAYMVQNPEVKHIQLTKLGSSGPHEPYKDPWLAQIPQNAKYRISTQAALWRTETLKSYLVPEENGWMFEIYGSWRSRRRMDRFLCARFDAEWGGPAIDYLHTGIVKGKWLREIRSVFEQNGIEIDYAKRGFYSPKHPVLRRIETASRLVQRPGYLLKQLW